jgi:hypothetical protein
MACNTATFTLCVSVSSYLMLNFVILSSQTSIAKSAFFKSAFFSSVIVSGFKTWLIAFTPKPKFSDSNLHTTCSKPIARYVRDSVSPPRSPRRL